MRTVTVEVKIDPDDVIDEISDERLLEECRDRELIGAGDVVGLTGTDKQAAEEVLADLFARRHGSAVDRLRSLLATHLPPGLFAAYEAMLAHDHSRAICELDRSIDPSPAATIATLPARATP